MTGPRIEQSADGEVIWLDNGLLRLGLVPRLGGRLLSLSGADGRELLWRNSDLLTDELALRRAHRPHSGDLGDWVNYGGDKTWPAPQGWEHSAQWAGPPDPVLDSGRYAAETDPGHDVATVTLTSGDDPRTGLRIVRRFELHRGRCRYRLTLTAINTTAREVRWSLWNVTQLAADGAGGSYVSGPAEVTDLLAGTGYPQWTELDGCVHVPHQDVVGKLGFPAAGGWLAHVGSGATLTQSFVVDPTAVYPDGGSRVEVWMEHPLPEPLAALGDLDPPARIVECEVLGPLTSLAPGERTTLTLDCAVTTGGEPVRRVTEQGHWTDNEFVPYATGVIDAGELIDVRPGQPVPIPRGHWKFVEVDR